METSTELPAPAAPISVTWKAPHSSSRRPGVLTTLYSFGPLNSRASNPVGGLIVGDDGAFYGVTAYSDASAGEGSVFKLVPP